MADKMMANYGGLFMEDNLWRTIYRGQFMEDNFIEDNYGS